MNRPNVIKQPWLSLVRLVWIILVSYNALSGLVLLPDYFRQLVRLDPWPNQSGWTQATFSAAVGRTGLGPQLMAWIVLLPTLVEILVFLCLGLIIFWRKSNEWPGLLVSFVLVGLCGTFTIDRFQILKALPPVLRVVGQEAGVLIWVAFFLFLILFPDGRFVPFWMRWVALGLAIWFVLTEGIGIIFNQAPVILFLFGFIFMTLILIGLISRYRRLSNPTERQQIRWFLFATLVFVIYTTLQFVLVRIFPLPPQPGPSDVAFYLVEVYLTDLSFILLPIAIGIAIFRYHLWDIDLIIRRTLQYGLLTVLLGLVYFGMVVLLGQVFRAITGQDSPLVVVLSTLSIAALFTPLRQRVQTIIDRRFFRQKYDSALALEEFSAAVRREVELEHLTADLARVLQKTVQPDGMSVWIRGSDLKITVEKGPIQ